MVTPTPYTPQQLADSVASEVRAELGRRSMSARDLAEATGLTHTYINARLTKRNPKTGLLTPLNMRDLSDFGGALDLHPSEFVLRGVAALEASGASKVIDIRDRKPSDGRPNLDYLKGEPSAAEPQRRDDDDETGDEHP